MFLRLLSFIFFLLATSCASAQTSYTLVSPSGNLRLSIETRPDLQWQLDLRGQALTTPTPISINIAGRGVLGQRPEVIKSEKNTVNRALQPAVKQKNASIQENYNELTLSFKGDWGLVFRVYNDGAAYRFFTKFNGAVTVLDETYSFRPATCKTVYFPEEEGFYSHNERIFQPLAPSALRENQLASLPALVETGSGVKILLTETDLQDYPGLWLNATNEPTGRLNGAFPRYPKYTVELTNRDIQPTDREPFLALTKGARHFPWRLFLVAEKDADLLNNQLPWLLAEPSRLKNTEWIRPGKVAWDWWNNLNLSGVDFRAGINTATYKYYVDFAAANGLEYIILDEGWCETGHLLQITAGLDMDELAAYAKQKGVGLILWVTWTSIDRQFETLLPSLKKWEVKGLKIDFMQRDDQDAVNYYWRIAEKCADNQLLADFHGAHKPAGLHRTWPNVLSFEGVYGLEQAKWDVKKQIDPEHDVTLPFIRQVAGPMDYTPGAMLNYQKNDWAPSFNRPGSLGTRCHELAKYVVFESPLQMLSDSPSNYKKEPECLHFLSKVPAVWEKTVAIDGKIGDYVAVARQGSDGLWYIGAMTDWTMRDLRINTDFLPAGDYEIESFQDGINADRNAMDYKRSDGHVKSGQMLRAAMAPGGGFVAILRKL
ncbi:MAG: glycoside hydrolase family 97 protein [Lewinellaceae bacterium]|nr:glycoside hydrolase family 97 protein [Lewinellaceae bacterium]